MHKGRLKDWGGGGGREKGATKHMGRGESFFTLVEEEGRKGGKYICVDDVWGGVVGL